MLNFTKTVLICFVFFGIFAGCSSENKSIKTKDELDARLAEIQSWNRIPGFSVSVFTKDKVLYQNAFGFENIHKKEQYTIGTSQMVASISKTVIAVALMKAEEDNILTLSDPINKYLDYEIANPYFPNTPITINHLARHTSSLKYSEHITDVLAFKHGQMPLGSFLKNFVYEEGEWYQKENFHNSEPGKLADYSNVGAALAANIIERATNQTFEEYTNNRIFKPLGMKNTYWHRSGKSSGSSLYYHFKSKGNFDQIAAKADALYPSGSLVTTIEDLTLFCQMVMNKGTKNSTQVLNPSSVATMLKFIKPKNSLDDEINSQGVFWYTIKSPLGIPRKLVGHNGGNEATYTMMFFDPKKDIGYILLSNVNMDADGTHVAFVNIYKSLWHYGKFAR